MASKIIDVYCKFGHLLFERYRKEKPGFLMKCYIERIGIDHIGAKGFQLMKLFIVQNVEKKEEN